MRSKSKLKTTFPHPSSSTSCPWVAQVNGVHGLQSVHDATPSTLLLQHRAPPQGCSPTWTDLAWNYHRQQFFKTYFDLGLYYGVQIFRNRLQQHESLMGCTSWQTTYSTMGFSLWAIGLLLRGLSTGHRLLLARSTSYSKGSSTGCSMICSSMVHWYAGGQPSTMASPWAEG